MDSYEQLVNQFTADARAHREKFRAAAKTACNEYGRADRQIVRGLETKDVNAQKVFLMWRTHLLPLHNAIDTKRSEAAFRKHISKHLVLEQEAAAQKATVLICERKEQALGEVITTLYVNGGKRQRNAAAWLLRQSDEKIAELERRYFTYKAYCQVACKERIVVIDAHTSIATRSMQYIKRAKERRTVCKKEMKRLIELHERLNELAGLHDGLIKASAEQKWDLATAMSLRIQYEKRLLELSETEAHNSATLLALYDEITHDFRHRHINEYAVTYTGLKHIRSVANGIDALLLHIFDLSNADKNQFMTLAKEYRELTKERAHLLHLQENRFSF